jgi:hypothetical protein
MVPQDDFDFERKGGFERRILGERGHRAQLYQLLDEDGNQVGRIRDAVNAASDHVYASEVIHLQNAKPNTVFDYQIHAYFGPAAENCSGEPFKQPGGIITTNQHGSGHLRVVVGEPGNQRSAS